MHAVGSAQEKITFIGINKIKQQDIIYTFYDNLWQFKSENFAILLQFCFDCYKFRKFGYNMSEIEQKESSDRDEDEEERRTVVSEEFNSDLRDAVIGMEISNRNDKVFSAIQELYGKVLILISIYLKNG